MSNSLQFDPQWTTGERGMPEERATMADLCIRLGDHVVTRCEDHWARSIRDRVRVSCYPLATWIASSWWRLLAEADSTDPSPRADWGMAHHMAAAGGGYLWPRLQFRSDGAFVEVSARASQPSPAEPMRFVGAVRESLEASEVERGLAEFVSTVVARLQAADIADSELQQLWSDIEAERRDASMRKHRQLEAMFGLDADAMDDDLDAQVAKLRAELGEAATLEIAAGGSAVAKRSDARAYLLDVFRTLDAGGIAASFDARLTTNQRLAMAGQPWQLGTELARRTRKNLKADAGPLPTAALQAWLGIGKVTKPGTAGSALAMARRKDRSTILFCRKNHPQARRFELARFLADHLITPPSEAGLVQSEATTVRQKIQRAFAAELLAPFSDVQAALAGDFTRLAIESVSAEFDVSTYVVTSQLVNNQLIPAGSEF
ncbi:MAG: hypothetical protein ACK501_20690 [Planctomycetota bacterium]|jgi:hypothetical protein